MDADNFDEKFVASSPQKYLRPSAVGFSFIRVNSCPFAVALSPFLISKCCANAGK
jgi:hypothetical protein